MIARERLPNRRRNESFAVSHAGLGFTASIGFFPDGRIAEIFLSSNKPGSTIEAFARDAAVTVSIALQLRADLGTIRRALTKDHDGQPATAIGAALWRPRHDSWNRHWRTRRDRMTRRERRTGRDPRHAGA